MHIERTAWEELRTSRSVRPGRAGDTPPRWQVFSSALEQAEQFFKAAAAVGPETQPVLAFYGLSQAGRAIAAAANALDGVDKKGGHLWQLKGHGIHTRDEAGLLPEVAAVTDSPGTSGSFVRLSELLGSPVWGKERVTLPELWDCLPDNCPSPLGAVPEARRMPLVLKGPSFDRPRSQVRGGRTKTTVISGHVADIPPHVVAAADGLQALKDYMTAFPHVRGYTFETRTRADLTQGPPAFFVRDDGGAVLWMEFPVPEDVDSAEGRLRQVLSIARRYRGSSYLFPTVGGSDLGIHPLMAWWAILHTLSTIARYQPAEWAGHTDVDHSRYAVPIERLLSDAVRVVPELIAETLHDVTC
ncbi:YaaC family protein [Streptacidiphilus fuscans]|uniref:YaaC-like Protein n=1 Tax=Streptacidiphilus fuscans TaxID=2789292 RepID=A0A931B7P2_9ACTN|nr:hypothetical protein [Streptacidiphilus fuscans]MBF9071728.1 hypothetical protein [Streptacidiphilus fuscans]